MNIGQKIWASLMACVLLVFNGFAFASQFQNKVDTEITLALAGDVSLARGIAQTNQQNWPRALQSIQQALGADVVFANLESPLTNLPRHTKGIDLRAPVAGVAALAPFDVLSTQNNHMLDAGEAGQRQSQWVLKTAGIQPITPQPYVMNLQGKKVAWLAFLDYGAAKPSFQAVQQAAELADWVIVSVHWGIEHGLVTQQQRLMAQKLANAGADVIVGHGPHVLQPHQYLTRQNSQTKTLVLYSLGNLLFDNAHPRNRVGAVVKVQLGAKKLASACAIPTRYRAGRVVLAEGSEQKTALRTLKLSLCSGAV